MNRLFTFGCSFTQYSWPTWADILGREFDHYENWGQAGGGNGYIFQSLIECYNRNQLTPDDTVIIMWTSTDRDDRYINNNWQTWGSIFNNPLYDTSYIKKYYDNRGNIIRDLGYIAACKSLLEAWGIKYKFLSMVPIGSSDQKIINSLPNDIEKLFNSTLAVMLPSIYETIYKNNWYFSEKFTDSVDKKTHIKILKDLFNTLSGPDWPTFNNFLADDYTNIQPEIIKEIEDRQLTHLKNNTPEVNLHATPRMHLQYLNLVLPEYIVTDSVRNWILNYKYGDEFNRHFPANRL